MKTVLFIPGYQEDIQSRNYKLTLDTIRTAGYHTKFVQINWKRTTISDWVSEFNEEYYKYNSQDIIIAGFSFGAMTAITAAANKNPYQLWLFSLSPYFYEDVVSAEWGKPLGKRRLIEFNKLKFNSIARNINCPSTIFIGEIEANKYPEMDIRFNQVIKQIKNIKPIFIPNTDHDVASVRYIKAIRQAI